ncbi:MAG: CDP-glycerol glycerophosphotransferase family protein, partial [Staphylococcus equorum]|nr:CDP-glycerol glycerophosphotransferase family protein [Staphylococcus equorum]
SVGLDFVLQQRKVLYFQFDNDIEELQTETDEHFLLPGPIFKTKQQLIIGLQEAINNNKLTEPYLEIVRKQLYSYKDTNACRRIYEVLDNM